MNPSASLNGRSPGFNKLLLLIPLGILALIALGVSIFAASAIEITPSGGTSSTYSYRILNQANGKLISEDSHSSKLKKRLGQGSYEVTVSQGTKTFFSLVSVKSRFGTTAVAASLQAEQKRTFVGDNPASCLNLLGATLLSHDCGSLNATVNTHVPATPKQPTYIDTTPSPFGNIVSTIKTTAGAVALFAKTGTSQGEDTPGLEYTAHTYDSLKPVFQPSDTAVLTDLKGIAAYRLQPYQAGFIAYDQAFSRILYYSSLHAKPATITLDTAKNPNMSAVSLDVSSSGEIAVAYTQNVESGDGTSVTTKPSITEVVVYKNGASTHAVFASQYSVVRYCGGTKLCMLNVSSNTLEVNELANGKAAQLFTVHGVTNLAVYDKGLLAVREDGLLRVDTATQTGFLAYSFGDYKYCGLDTVVNGHVICLTNPQGIKAALYLDPSGEDNSSIDKKVLQLEKYSNVAKLSIVGNIIYVIPKGEVVYNLATRSIAPDPAVQGPINRGIMAEASKIGIDASYTLIITRPL